MKIEIGKVYNSNFCGDYKVLSKDPNKKNYYIIKFIKTNYIKSVRYDCISNGVIYHHGAYNVEIQINGVVHRIERYKDPIVAANAANYARLFYGLEILNKNIPIIPKEIVNSQNIRKKQEIVTKINK